MLLEICCDQFSQKKIRFNAGLSVVLGSNTGDNSIGKTTFLLIVDFVFGGNTYAKSTDIIHNVGSHDIFFAFKFHDEVYKFCRNNTENHEVWKCNHTYEKIEKLKVDEYCNWLKTQYELDLPELTFRNSVGRYMRVYGKENCRERYPLHSFYQEKNESASYELLKLFDKYTPLKAVKEQADASAEALKLYKKAQSMKFITQINKTTFKRNIEDIEKITQELEELTKGLDAGLMDVDSFAAEEAVEIKDALRNVRRIRGKVKKQYDLLSENGEYKFSDTSTSYRELGMFFPSVDIAKLEEIESFHKNISSIFKAELRAEKQQLQKELESYDTIIHEYMQELEKLVKNPNLSKMILKRHAELLKRKEQMEQENQAYTKSEKLKKDKDDDKNRLISMEKEQFALVECDLNLEMKRINAEIYGDRYAAPVLRFDDAKYMFFTPDDTGTGIAYKGLVVYDLAVLALTKLPVIVHDSILLKQISDEAIEQILSLYEKCGKQVIIALDKQDSYGKQTSMILNRNAVLRLASNGQELFGRSWG